MIFLSLFITFFKIGLFGFGGGYGMLSLIQHETVIAALQPSRMLAIVTRWLCWVPLLPPSPWCSLRSS